MSRLSQAISYINSTTEDWTTGTVSNKNFTSLSLTEDLKKLRRWYRYGKEPTFEDYVRNQEKLIRKKNI